MVSDVHVDDIPPRGRRHLEGPSYWDRTLLKCGMHEGVMSFAIVPRRGCVGWWWWWVTKQKQEQVLQEREKEVTNE